MDEDNEEEEDDCNAPKSTKRRNSSPTVIFDPYQLDWYGNLPLHHQMSKKKINITYIRLIIGSYPNSVSQQNQFGRIPLHYVVDKSSVGVNLTPLVSLLLYQYPEGANIQDHEGITPYNLAVKWGHSKSVLKLLLNVYPEQDYEMYLMLIWGYHLYTVFKWTTKLLSRLSNPININTTTAEHNNIDEELNSSGSSKADTCTIIHSSSNASSSSSSGNVNNNNNNSSTLASASLSTGNAYSSTSTSNSIGWSQSQSQTTEIFTTDISSTPNTDSFPK